MTKKFGVDINTSLQENFDPQIVKSNGGSFIIVKISEGLDNSIYTDWKRVVDKALSIGLDVGLYHFVTADNFTQQADKFTSTAGSYAQKCTLWLDFENGQIGNEIRELNESHKNGAIEFINRVTATTENQCGIYMASSTTNKFDWSAIAGKARLWRAQYANYDPMGFTEDFWTDGTSNGHWGHNVAIYQYSSNGRLTGWNAGLDINYTDFPDGSWLKTLTGSKPAPQPQPQPQPHPPIQSKPNVFYALRQKGGSWLPEVKNATDFAGNPSHEHDMLYIRVDKGSLRYRVHVKGGGWLGWVSNGNKNDLVNGCAGNPNQAIDGVQIYYTSVAGQVYQAWYQSQSAVRSGWLGVCCDDGTSIKGFDGWAGILGEAMDRLQIDINNHKPF